MVSVTALENSIKSFAKKLNKQGINTNIVTYRSGAQHSCIHTGGYPSTVTLELKRGDKLATIRFMANGYSGWNSNDIGEWGMKWSEMKAEANKKIQKLFPVELQDSEKALIQEASAEGGLLRKFLSSGEIKIANKLVKLGFMSKGVSDDKQQNVCFFADKAPCAA